MTVYEMLYLATEDGVMVEIFDLTEGSGEILTIADAMIKYGDYEVLSFDSFVTNSTLCINIER